MALLSNGMLHTIAIGPNENSHLRDSNDNLGGGVQGRYRRFLMRA
jgi:hypothetical protein